MSLRRRTAWGVYVVLGTVVAGAYFVVPPTPVTKLVLYNGLGLSAVLAVLTGVRRHRPASARPWYLFAAGQLSFLTADVIFYVAQDILHVESPFPSAADAFYLGMYPLVIAGLVLLIRRLVPGRDQASLLDAAIIATGMFVLTGCSSWTPTPWTLASACSSE